MEFKELLEEVKKVKFAMLRQETEDYFEAVVSKSELGDLNACLEKFLGPAIWPSAKPLPKDISAEIDEFGGVMSGQTLYFFKQEGRIIFAMFWPWANGVSITLKLGKK